MITEVLLILPLCLILFLIWWQFRHLINIIADIENILNDDDFFTDIADTPKQGIEQHRKWKYLKSFISKDKAYLLGKKWTHEKVGRASDKTINKTYAGYKQRELDEKGEKTEKALRKQVINLYSTENSLVIKIRDVKKLQQDIENDPIIKDQMVNLGCLLVCSFGSFLASALAAAHTVNNLDLGDRQDLQNEGYESD